jgi:HAD superfamily hydrolase (TIGR01509 family)
MRATALVIFDCDGVLVDSEPLSHAVLQQMLAEQGAVLDFDDTVRRFIGLAMPQGMAVVRELLGAEPPPGFYRQMAERTRQAFLAGLTVVPGVEAVLDALTVDHAVASNGNRAKVAFTLGHTGLLPRMAGRIFTADDVTHPKPAPDLFLHAARSLGAAPELAVVVEDTPTGVRAAKAAGMRAIGFAAMTPAERLHAAGADAVAHDMAQVQRQLADWCAARPPGGS